MDSRSHQGERARTRVVALRHDREDAPVPRVSAKGAGELGRRILEVAREHDVPVREDPDLVELLAACEPGDDVPPEMWRAVAELLAFLHRLNGGPAEHAPGVDARP